MTDVQTPVKNRGVAIALAILVGWLGVDQLYLGKVSKGLWIGGAYLASSMFLITLANSSPSAANLVGIVQIAFVLFGWWRAFAIATAKTDSGKR